MNAPERPKQQADLEAPFAIASFGEAATALHAIQSMQANPDEHHRLSMPSRYQKGEHYRSGSVTLGDLVEREDTVYKEPVLFTDGDAILIRGALRQLAKHEEEHHGISRVSQPHIMIARQMLEHADEQHAAEIAQPELAPIEAARPMVIPLDLARALDQGADELGATGEIPVVQQDQLTAESLRHVKGREPVVH